MLTRIHGKFQTECDACGEVLETDTSDFTEALRIMRNENWQAKKIGQDWVHTCFGCTNEADKERRARSGKRIP